MAKTSPCVRALTMVAQIPDEGVHDHPSPKATCFTVAHVLVLVLDGAQPIVEIPQLSVRAHFGDIPRVDEDIRGGQISSGAVQRVGVTHVQNGHRVKETHLEPGTLLGAFADTDIASVAHAYVGMARIAHVAGRGQAKSYGNQSAQPSHRHQSRGCQSKQIV